MRDFSPISFAVTIPTWRTSPWRLIPNLHFNSDESQGATCGQSGLCSYMEQVKETLKKNHSSVSGASHLDVMTLFLIKNQAGFKHDDLTNPLWKLYAFFSPKWPQSLLFLPPIWLSDCLCSGGQAPFCPHHYPATIRRIQFSGVDDLYALDVQAKEGGTPYHERASSRKRRRLK